ncbi:cytochrome c oxidase cbb3-type subunit 4 [Onishia taeanensis]|uniref:Cytochrome c oxidase cbb3-type subunit 4 n=1 Tax=Onishia taeanensis TaxID=284577 RepID=A0A1G7PG68_9GAMM|nr:cbb3-type cytochrome c oxidase subunit 3 [Halomonas taeanensis]MAX31450.1 cbb3-type cytochrome c oxidase subunit 3 [Halomonadaceae bacterium]SDF84490.1 cytochrome c oxidase cbb3-type subunit 4 [Halomonas taeanensis]
MDMGTFRGITTLLILIAFLGIVAWAYSKRRRKDFDEAANLPFADEQDEVTDSDRASPGEVDARQDKGDKNT